MGNRIHNAFFLIFISYQNNGIFYLSYVKCIVKSTFIYKREIFKKNVILIKIKTKTKLLFSEKKDILIQIKRLM